MTRESVPSRRRREGLSLLAQQLLWAAPVSVAGLALMFVGLVCAVGAFTLEKTQQF